MLLASIVGAVFVTVLLLGAGLLWALNEQTIARTQGWEIAFFLKDELVKTLSCAVFAAVPMWINVLFVNNNPDDMPAEFYLPTLFVGVGVMGAYIALVIWRLTVLQKVKSADEVLLQKASPYRRKGS